MNRTLQQNPNFILLAGNSVFNKEWIYQIKQALEQTISAKAYVIEYKHWHPTNKQNTANQNNNLQQPPKIININTELKQLQNLITQNNIQEVLYIFAKSAGTLLTLHAINQNIIKPNAVFFFGIPYYWAKKNFNTDIIQLILNTSCNNKNIKFYIWQKPQDPAIGYSKLLEKLSTLAKNTDNNHCLNNDSTARFEADNINMSALAKKPETSLNSTTTKLNKNYVLIQPGNIILYEYKEKHEPIDDHHYASVNIIAQKIKQILQEK